MSWRKTWEKKEEGWKDYKRGLAKLDRLSVRPNSTALDRVSGQRVRVVCLATPGVWCVLYPDGFTYKVDEADLEPLPDGD